MLMTGQGIIDQTLTIGAFVMANTYLMQLYQPLGFFGFVYREIKQALIDIERCWTCWLCHRMSLTLMTPGTWPYGG